MSLDHLSWNRRVDYDVPIVLLNCILGKILSGFPRNRSVKALSSGISSHELPLSWVLSKVIEINIEFFPIIILLPVLELDIKPALPLRRSSPNSLRDSRLISLISQVLSPIEASAINRRNKHPEETSKRQIIRTVFIFCILRPHSCDCHATREDNRTDLGRRGFRNRLSHLDDTLDLDCLSIEFSYFSKPIVLDLSHLDPAAELLPEISRYSVFAVLS